MTTPNRPHRVIAVDFQNTEQRRCLRDLLIAYSADNMGQGKVMERNVATQSVALLAEKSYALSFLCYEEQNAVGFANCFETIATFAGKPAINIHDIAVLQTHRRRGIASALLQSIEDYALENNYCKMTLEVLEGNIAAQNTYRKFGFDAYRLDPKLGPAQFWQKVFSS